jgi:hypothetical protein
MINSVALPNRALSRAPIEGPRAFFGGRTEPDRQGNDGQDRSHKDGAIAPVQGFGGDGKGHEGQHPQGNGGAERHGDQKVHPL